MIAYATNQDELLSLTTDTEANLVVNGKVVLPSQPMTPEEQELEKKKAKKSTF
ncbi:MAG TPA: hypothetical protein VII93_09320 [Anaerolineales bacterium]